MGNLVVTLSFGRLRFRPECVVILGVQGLHAWAHVLDFNLAHVRLFQTPDFCEA